MERVENKKNEIREKMREGRIAASSTQEAIARAVASAVDITVW